MEQDDDKISRAIEDIRTQIRLEQERIEQLKIQNDLANQALDISRQLKQAEQQRTRLWLEISEGTASLMQQFPEFKAELSLTMLGFAEKLDEFDDHLKDTSKRLDRIEYALMLLLAGKGNGNRGKAEALVKTIEADRIKRLVSDKRLRLEILERQYATYGELHVPPHVVVEIEDLKQEIVTLERNIEISES